MSKELPPSRTAEQFVVRFPDGMRDRIAEAAKASGRSMNAEIVQRLEASFGAEDGMPAPSKATRTDWAERFQLYRIEAQLDAVKTQQGLAAMQVRMLDDKLDQLVREGGSKVTMRALEVELQSAKELCVTLEARREEVYQRLLEQQARADEASSVELHEINVAIDRTLQDEFQQVHALEERLGVPMEARTIVPLKKAARKPKA